MTDAVPTLDDVLDLLAGHEERAHRTLNLVPSENVLSGLAKVPLVLDSYHRYFFNESGAPDRWTFRGAQGLRDIEMKVTIPLLQRLGKASHVSVRPLSGLNGMTLALGTLGGPPGSTVVTIGPGNGGHYATPSVAARLGLRVEFLTGPTPHDIDWEAATVLLRRVRPTLVYVDQSHCLFPVDVAELVRTVRAASPETVVHVDASHWMGFVLGGVHPNPLDLGADSFGGSTHKTFPGPQKAVLLTNDPGIDARIRETQDYLISSHHLAAVISLGIALLEFAEFGPGYAAAILANTKDFAAALSERGLTLAAADRGYTAGHQLWLDTESDGVPAPLASDRLAAAGLVVNYMEGLPGFPGRGVRIGLNEATYHGLSGVDVPELADVFATAVTGTEPPAALAARTAELRRRWAHDGQRSARHDHLTERAREVVATALPLRYRAAASSFVAAR
ncbi:hypothetical protein [Lentzea sp. NPDC060358]|uniref:hypothetical protein n=1 Tax=Lentzea sp. NPDC060358 TaxID=3347103 RepID=UPI00365AD517